MAIGTGDHRLPQQLPPADGRRLRKKHVSLTPRQARDLPIDNDPPLDTAVRRMLQQYPVQQIATDLDSAVSALVEQSLDLLGQFEELFRLRAELPGLVESLPQPLSLIKVLSALLKCGYESARPVKQPVKSDAATDAFLLNMRIAIAALPEKHPSALQFFEHHRQSADIGTTEAFSLLLNVYLARGKSLPY